MSYLDEPPDSRTQKMEDEEAREIFEKMTTESGHGNIVVAGGKYDDKYKGPVTFSVVHKTNPDSFVITFIKEVVYYIFTRVNYKSDTLILRGKDFTEFKKKMFDQFKSSGDWFNSWDKDYSWNFIRRPCKIHGSSGTSWEITYFDEKFFNSKGGRSRKNKRSKRCKKSSKRRK